MSNIFEVWHYDGTETYNPVTKTVWLFSEYINTFLRIKHEVDGWPECVQTDDDKTEYIRQYEDREGFHLDPSNIEKIQVYEL